MTSLDEPIRLENGTTWATYAVTSRLVGVPERLLYQWVYRGHIEVAYTSEYGVLIRFDQAQDREMKRRRDPRHLYAERMSDPLATVPDAPTLPC